MAKRLPKEITMQSPNYQANVELSKMVKLDDKTPRSVFDSNVVVMSDITPKPRKRICF